MLEELCIDRRVTERPMVQTFLLDVGRDRSSAHRGAALKCAAEVRPAEVTKIGMPMLARERDPVILQDIVMALANAKDSEAVSAILALASHASPKVRGAVFDALGVFKAPEGLAVLEAGLHDQDPWLRVKAGLAYIGQPGRRVEVLRKFLSDKDAGPSVARALAKQATADVTPLLQQHIFDHPESFDAIPKVPASDGPDRQAVLALLRVLVADPRIGAAVRARAAEQLGRACDPG